MEIMKTVSCDTEKAVFKCQNPDCGHEYKFPRKTEKIFLKSVERHNGANVK